MFISLNLASRPFSDQRPTLVRMRIAMSALVLAAVVLGLVLRVVHRKAVEAHTHLHSLDGEIANILREQQGYQFMMSEPENARTQVETRNLNQLFNQKAFSWTLVMVNLETVLPAGVRVTAIEPQVSKTGRITLHLRVFGPRDRSIDLVQNLENSKCFFQPRIVNESTDTGMGNNDKLGPVSISTPTNFDLLADYNPDSAEQFMPVEPTPPAPAVNPPSPAAASLVQHRLILRAAASPVARQQAHAGGLQ
jgi:type IV pilus assembly protein PilN